MNYVVNTPLRLPRKKDIIDLTQDDNYPLAPSPVGGLGRQRPNIAPSPRPRATPILAPKPSHSLDVYPTVSIMSGSRTPSAAGNRAPSVQRTPSMADRQNTARTPVHETPVGFWDNSVYSYAEGPSGFTQPVPSPSMLHTQTTNPMYLSPNLSAQHLSSLSSPTQAHNLEPPAYSYPTPALTPTPAASNLTPTSTSTAWSKITKESLPSVSLQIYHLLRERARNPHGLASCATLHHVICKSIASQIYRKPDWVPQPHHKACTKHMNDFGRAKKPQERKAVEVSQEVGGQCVRIGKQKHKSWAAYEAAEERDGRVMLRFAPNDEIPMAAVLDFQHETVYPWLRYDQSSRYVSLTFVAL